MIGFDTNVLVRFFAQDDPVQCKEADEVMAALSPESPGWVSLAVVLELVWVMTRIYGVDRAGMIGLLESLLALPSLVIEQSNTVYEALRLYRIGNAEFADCLIASSARAAGCSRILTFDRVAARDAGMKHISEGG